VSRKRSTTIRAGFISWLLANVRFLSDEGLLPFWLELDQ
jgi:hypothetical protein